MWAIRRAITAYATRLLRWILGTECEFILVHLYLKHRRISKCTDLWDWDTAKVSQSVYFFFVHVNVYGTDMLLRFAVVISLMWFNFPISSGLWLPQCQRSNPEEYGWTRAAGDQNKRQHIDGVHISGDVQYTPRNMHTVFALLCFVVVIHWLIFPYPSGLLHWHWGNLTIAPVPAKQPWWIWINTSCEFIMNDCITTTKQSTTKPCAYFLGYTVLHVYPSVNYPGPQITKRTDMLP